MLKRVAATMDAVAEYEAGHYQEARALFRQAHEKSPTARTLRGIGMASFELRDYVEATRALTASLRDVRPPPFALMLVSTSQHGQTRSRSSCPTRRTQATTRRLPCARSAESRSTPRISTSVAERMTSTRRRSAPFVPIAMT